MGFYKEKRLEPHGIEAGLDRIAQMFNQRERSNTTVRCPFHAGAGALIAARDLDGHLVRTHALTDKDARLIRARTVAQVVR